MEEKERYYYKKILRDCVMPEGLFEIKDREGNFYLIIENKKDVDTITNLLNQQDKRIKELETEIEKYKLDELADAVADLGMPKLSKHELWQSIEQQHSKNMALEKLLEKANDEKLELEQSQKQLAINELKKLKDFIDHNIEIENDVGALKLEDFYSNQIKSLKQE